MLAANTAWRWIMDEHRPDAEAKMRESLGLSDASTPPCAADPQRLARQAIRSQAAAREYAERHLLRAEQTIQELSAKLQAVRREKGIAVHAALTAQAALAEAERGRRAAEAALTNAQAASERAQREAHEARATVHDLRAKLSVANQSIGDLQAQLQQERQARTAAEQVLPAAQVPLVADAAGAGRLELPVPRRRGRPPGKRDASVPPPAARRSDADQAPVKWWIDGWTRTT
jgi:hypothetical protein